MAHKAVEQAEQFRPDLIPDGRSLNFSSIPFARMVAAMMRQKAVNLYSVREYIGSDKALREVCSGMGSDGVWGQGVTPNVKEAVVAKVTLDRSKALDFDALRTLRRRSSRPARRARPSPSPRDPRQRAGVASLSG